MAFDAARLLEALEPPTFVHPRGRLRHWLRLPARRTVGRFLSAPQWMAFAERLAQLQQGKLSYHEVVTLYGDLTRLMFPIGWLQRMARVFGARWCRTVLEDLALLPHALQVEALRSFFDSQASAMRTMARRAARTQPPAPPTT